MSSFFNKPSRRDLFRSLAVGSMLGSAFALFMKAYNSGEDCIGDGKCKKCFALQKCSLPPAKDYKSTHFGGA